MGCVVWFSCIRGCALNYILIPLTGIGAIVVIYFIIYLLNKTDVTKDDGKS